MLIPTVTLAVVATDKVAVKVNDDPAFSSIELAEDVRVTVGALSFSFIVIVTFCGVLLSLADPPETVSIATIPVSLPSYTLSSVGVNEAVPVVAPAETIMSEIVA